MSIASEIMLKGTKMDKSNHSLDSKVIANRSPYNARFHPETTHYTRGQMLFGRVIRASSGGLSIELPNHEIGFVTSQEMGWPDFPIPYRLGGWVWVTVLSFKPSKALYLSLKKAQAKANIEKNFKIWKNGDVLHGKIKSMLDYGVFVTIDAGVDGLVHVSSFPGKSPYDYEVGASVTVRIIKIDHDAKRIQLEFV